MPDFITRLFDTSGFPPRWKCGVWTTDHGWLHILSDLVVFAAYMAIPVALWHFARRRADWPFRHLLWLFGAFILLCGTTHLMEAAIFWWPAYRLAGVLKFATAAVSWATVVALVPVLPRAMAMRSPEELEREVAARRAAEAELVKTNAVLEDRVRERTEQLTAANAALFAERERFRTTLASIGDAVIATDTAGRVTFLNAAAEGLTGWPTETAVGQPLQDVFHIIDETARTPADNPAVRVLQDGVVVGLANQTVLVGRDGSERPIDDSAAPIRDGSGGISGAVLVFRDVSDRRRAESLLRRSEERYRTVLEDQTEVVSRFAADGTFTFVSQVYSRTFGKDAAQLIGTSWVPVAHPDDIPTVDAALAQLSPGRPVMRVENRVYDAVGRVRWMEFVNRGFFDAEGRLAEVQSVGRDVSDRKATEERLGESEERYRLLFEESPLPTWVYDQNTLAFLEVNAAAVAKYGYTRAEFLSRTVKDIRPPDDVPALLAVMASADGPDQGSVWRHRLRDGRAIRVRVATHNLTFRGRPARLVQALDVTEQLRAEEELRASEVRYKLLFAVNPHPMWVFDRQTLAFLEVNDAAVAKYGYTRAEFLALTLKDIRPPEDVPALLADVAANAGGLDDAGVWRHRLKDGRVIRVRVVSHSLTFDGRPAEVVMADDVTDRLRAEAELRASEERLQLALSAGGMGTFDWDVATGSIVWSSSHYELFGYDPAALFPVEFRHFTDRIHPDDRPDVERKMREAMAGRSVYAHEYRVRRPDGGERWLAGTGRYRYDADGRAVRMVGVVQDVSARKGLEMQLRQAQKLEAIGQLAGGVAHDFNNLLTVVSGCGELLLADLPADAPARPLVEDIIGAGERGAALTRQLLAFGRQQMFRVEVFDPNRVLPETAKMLARLLGEDVALRLALDPAAGLVKADVGQVEQVVINLAVNARDAMPRGGTLTVETAAVTVADTDPLPSPDARPGRYVRLAVTDTGTGIPPDVLARLFEPFFTTKPAGQGTGLGLATVYGIVRQSGGYVTVRTEVGAGTTFAAHLPRHEEEPAGGPADARPESGAARGESVLVVEDDGAVRAVAAAVLGRRGYRVAAAESGEAALAACDRLPEPPDLVLTDVVMPGMGGRELAERLTARYPGVKVAFLSGYTADAVLRHGVEEDRVAFLQKPYTPDALTRFVRRVLDGADAP